MSLNKLDYKVDYETFINEVKRKYRSYCDFCRILPSGGKKRRSNKYLIAEHNGWLESVKNELDIKQVNDKEKEYRDLVSLIKQKYKSYDDFQRNRKSYEYNVFRHNKWTDRIIKDCFPEHTLRKHRGYWNNFDICLAESKKYTSRKEMAKYSGTAYYYARTKYLDEENNIKWIDAMIPLPSMNNKVGNVYYFLFENVNAEGKQHAIYIGITIHPEKRNKNHRNGTTKSSVYEFAKKYNVDIPEMKFFAKNISVLDSTRLEKEYVDEYRKKGYFIINKAKCGVGSSSVGAYNSNDLSFYTYERLVDHIKNVKKYKTYEEFRGSKENWTDEYKRAFTLCVVRKINKACGFTPGHNRYFSLEEFIEDVKTKYNTYEKFRNKDKKHNTNEWITAMRHSNEKWLIKTVETLYPDKIDETMNFIEKSKNKMLTK